MEYIVERNERGKKKEGEGKGKGHARGKKNPGNFRRSIITTRKNNNVNALTGRGERWCKQSDDKTLSSFAAKYNQEGALKRALR